MPVEEQLLEILICPKCSGPLEYDETADEIVCGACRLRFEVDDGIPIMLIDEAKPF